MDVPWESEKSAWDKLSLLPPEEVCPRAEVTYHPIEGFYRVKFFSSYLLVSLKDRSITEVAMEMPLWSKVKNGGSLVVLHYLLRARNIPFTCELINPLSLPGGEIYRTGYHVLPLDKVATRYATDLTGFLAKGKSLHGHPLAFGDASFMLRPLPRIAVAFVLWLENGEFPARVSLLVDSSVKEQLPPDILWLALMMCVTLVQE